MSKRFGRNQRRRARQEIFRLQEEKNKWEKAYHRDTGIFEQRLRRYEHQLERIVRILGPNFIGLEAQIKECSTIDEYLKLRIRIQKALLYDPMSADFPPTWDILQERELDKFIFYLEKDTAKFRGEHSGIMHFRLKCTNGTQAAYAIDFNQLYDLRREHLVQILTENFSYMIANYIEKDMKGMK